MTGFRIISGGGPRQRRPRIEDDRHLKFIRQLPCVITGSRPADAAHLRIGNPLVGKRAVGVAEKPDDLWTIPLCRRVHYEQHSMKELDFWESYGIFNPWQLCLALYAASVNADAETAERIIAEHKRITAGL